MTDTVDDSLDYNGDFLETEAKLEDTSTWTDTVEVPLGDDTITLAHRLLTERERVELRVRLPMDDLQEYQNEDMGEERERILELQEKDDLTEAEKEELKELHASAGQQIGGLLSALGQEGVNALMDAGKWTVQPTEADLNDVIQAPRERQKEIFNGDVPNVLDHETVREPLADAIRKKIEAQPYLIKLHIGLKALNETNGVTQGN
jgi:hypothetical protein